MDFDSILSAAKILNRVRRSATNLLPVLSSISTAFMIWKLLCVLSNSPCPVLVVSSESMAPAFHRGDIIVIWNRGPFVRVGDIPIVWLPGRSLPMVHRAIKIQHDSEHIGNDARKRQRILTKGDNNEVDDTRMYGEGKHFVERDEIFGVVWGYVPILGWPTIAFHEIVWSKIPWVRKPSARR